MLQEQLKRETKYTEDGSSTIPTFKALFPPGGKKVCVQHNLPGTCSYFYFF